MALENQTRNDDISWWQPVFAEPIVALTAPTAAKYCYQGFSGPCGSTPTRAKLRHAMLLGLGHDIIEVARLERALASGPDGLREEIFTPGEIAYCEAMHHPARHFAARFAAKEALFKALGSGWRGGLAWREVEVRKDEQGKPEIVLAGKTRDLAERLRVRRVLVSLSHTQTLAAASVVLEAGDPEGGKEPREPHRFA
jgi:holo-[acyl-carrier protein] synthase